ncbi:centrosomal protein CEP76, putative (CEP76) [Plasmodium ovale curtisi]|uniref:Centrosomal protein CEP76, putative (CEP76) n=1 Tax=Plasmodium ovale curtisi TaxID=864141 RepID=A0A1A8VYQ1_PLAOA|nr:centrosomal protein CEP76, putative (CEP76) [Plasmodium ovale curtisi]
MFLLQKVKEYFFENEDNHELGEQKGKKKVHISELKDEIWLYKNEYNKERLSEEYISEYEDEEDYYDDDNGKKPREHFLEVPLFDEDEYGRNIKKNLRSLPSKKVKAIKKNEEEEISEESLSTTDEEEDVDEPFLDLYEELKREQRIKEFYNPMLKPRLWRFEFFIKYIHNLENQIQKNFYLVSFGNNKKIKLYGDLKKEVLYTPGYSIQPGEVKYLRIPLPIWAEKELSISYEDLRNFEITIEMWCIKGFIFNDLYASSKKNLKEIIENDPDTNIILKRKIEKKNITFEAQRLGFTLFIYLILYLTPKVYMQLSEIFEFHMALDSWWFIANTEMPSYLKALPKFLRFKFPLSDDDWVIHSSYKSFNNFWLYPGYFCFIGTYQQLANAFFILTVLCYNSNYRYKPPILLGSCIISLKSVTEYPFFKGIVKKLTLEKKKFRQGEIVGNIKCFVNSYGIDESENNIQRPVQPLSDATLVNQLILNDHYLVIRVIKCENLAISSIDLNNVNVNVWVKWDGIVNKTDTISKTTSPFFYQNLYYPIRLVDKKELTNEKLIRNVLPIDLISKGEICFEVHNNNEIYSTILGIFELPFADIFNYGTYDYRSLAQDNTVSNSMYNDYKDTYEVVNGGTNISSDNYDDYYVRKYKTVVYKNTLELMYSKVHLKSLNKENIHTKTESTISVEAFVIPPLPSGLVFFKENKVQNASVVYKSMSKRWERDFAKFNDTYVQWFPKAIKNRSFPCISKNDFDNNFYPLCSFISSINLPAQVSTPGIYNFPKSPLFHWLNNIEYIENEDESTIFTPPYFFLSYKKGTIPDHVLLLCCCLKGLEYDAYVCKGTINNGKNDHYWVMTRHENGWICFWEVTNKSIIHLNNRWNNNNFLKNSEITIQNEMINKVNHNNDEKYYSGEYLMNFVRYALDEFKKKEKEIKEEYNMKEENKLYTMDIYGENNMNDEQVNIEEILQNDEDFFNNMFEVKYEKNETYNCNKALKYLLENFSKYIPISPKMFLVDYENTLAYVPYTSIEIVFNDEQLYGNMQNHHPACILYDLENNYHWRPFLDHSPIPIKNEITISTPLSDKLSVKYTNDLEEEIREMILFMRNKEGLETNFEYSKEIKYFLEMYIDLCEYKLNLDNNYNTKPENYKWSDGRNKPDEEGERYEGYMEGEKVQSKKTWSQYKNDFYPNIEAQYVNKDDLNFYNSYHPARNVEMMNREKKQHLSSIPQDYVYGMNDEVYNNGKEQYIQNYVFSKKSTDILNNYDESVKKKNIKRFNSSAVHYKENVIGVSDNYLEEFPDLATVNMVNSANVENTANVVHTYLEVNTDSPAKQICKKKNHGADTCITENLCTKNNVKANLGDTQQCGEGDIKGGKNNAVNEEELYREIREKYYYDEDDDDDHHHHQTDGEEEKNRNNSDIPSKYIKKYNRQHNNLFKLQKSLRKKEKFIGEELIDIKLRKKNYAEDRMHKALFRSFIDTQEFLMHKLSSKKNEKGRENDNHNEPNNLNTSCGQSKWDKNISMFNGYFFIPSKGGRTQQSNTASVLKPCTCSRNNIHPLDVVEKREMSISGKIDIGLCSMEKTELTQMDVNRCNNSTKACQTKGSCTYMHPLRREGCMISAERDEKGNIFYENNGKLRTLVGKCKKRHKVKMIKKKRFSFVRYDGRGNDTSIMKRNMPSYKFILLKNRFKGKKKEKIFHFEKIVSSLNSKMGEEKHNSFSTDDKEIVCLNKRKKFLKQSQHQMQGDSEFFYRNHDQLGTQRNEGSIKRGEAYSEHPVVDGCNMDNGRSNLLNNNVFEGNFGECVLQGSMRSVYDEGGNMENGANGENSEDALKKKDSHIPPPKTWSRLDATSKYVAHQISQWNWRSSISTGNITNFLSRPIIHLSGSPSTFRQLVEKEKKKKDRSLNSSYFSYVRKLRLVPNGAKPWDALSPYWRYYVKLGVSGLSGSLDGNKKAKKKRKRKNEKCDNANVRMREGEMGENT